MQFAVVLFCIVAATAASRNADSSESVELTISGGKIRGSLMKTRLGKTIYSFRSMRYAEPPVGELRFKQAVPVAPWNDVFDATQDGPCCPQPGGFNPSEDCLRVNVYSTKLPSGNSSEVKKPVLIFFHPGAYYIYSGQSKLIGPEYFMDQDIVLVVTNYRLGSLGMISTGDANAPGNLALKDQVESLRWIQKNIAVFGGDPNSVTITGYSAGSWSVGLHLVSPMSKGLFHRALAMSGSAIYQTPLHHNRMDLAKKQAEFVGCPSDNSSIIIECLRTKDAMEIANTLPQFFEWHGDPVLVWAPVIEPEIPGVERFLSAHPSDLIREGKFQHLPFITGICKDEFGGVVVSVVEAAQKGDFSVINDINANWTKIAPISYLYERDTPRSLVISAALKQFYFDGQPLSLANMDSLSHLYADALIIFSEDRFVKLMAQASTAPVWYYEFAYQGRYSHVVWNNTGKPFGVVHHDDLLYLFWDNYFPYWEPNAPELTTVERQTSMWAHFAKTGEPIPRDNPLFANVTWTPFTLKNNEYLQITDELVMKKNLYSDRMAVWERLFPLKPLL